MSGLTLSLWAILLGCCGPFTVKALGASRSCQAADIQNLVTQCKGCHGQQRTESHSKFPDGTSKWADYQCFGCHNELNEVSHNFKNKIRDPRIQSLPYPDRVFEKIAAKPLSYMKTPKELAFRVGSIQRLSHRGVLEFAKRPFYSGIHSLREGSMPGFSTLSLQAIECLAKETGSHATRESPGDAKTVSQGAELFKAHCETCHQIKSDGVRRAQYLSLFTPEWIEAYANGKAQHPWEKRTMPVVGMNNQQSVAIAAYLKDSAEKLWNQVEAETEKLRKRIPTDLPKYQPQMGQYIYGGFFRDAMCSHCHAGATEASKKFLANEAGLKTYLKKNDPWELWRRLETRVIEDQHGALSIKPGMPLGLSPLPVEMRGLVGAWIAAGCPGRDGKMGCL